MTRTEPPPFIHDDTLALAAVTDTVVRIMRGAPGPLRRVSVAYDHNGARIDVDLDPGTPTDIPARLAGAPEVPAGDLGNRQVVTSPMVGIVYLAPEPNADTFVTVGSTVAQGQQLCIVEAMKLMNAVRTECAGTVAEVLVADGTPVEFGQPLFAIAVGPP